MEQSANAMELTLAELAALMKAGESRIIRLIKTAGLPGYQTANEWRFRIEDISAWMSDVSRISTVRRNRPRKLAVPNQQSAHRSKSATHSDRAPSRIEIRYRRKA
jgi:excisionase family DNA binding protein